MKLKFHKETSASVLSGFHCGVRRIDDFIHKQLGGFLNAGSYSLYTVRYDTGELVAMFVTGQGAILRGKGQKLEIEDTGSVHTVFEDGELVDMVRYDAIELEYLAVEEEYRRLHIGSKIIEELSERARREGKYFITVGAYHEDGYSAIPFYERNQFCPLEDYDEETDTLKMYRYVWKDEPEQPDE